MNIPFSCFRVFDQNGDGNISKKELKNAMISFGQIFSAAEADEMFTVSISFAFTMRRNLLNWCNLVSISKKLRCYVFGVVRIY